MNYIPKNQLKVDEKMSELGADKVGLRLANAALNYAPSQPEPPQQQIDSFTP